MVKVTLYKKKGDKIVTKKVDKSDLKTPYVGGLLDAGYSTEKPETENKTDKK